MFYYEVGYGTMEESEYTTLVHEKSYTDKHLESIIHEAIIEAIKVLKKDKREYLSSYNYSVHRETIKVLVEHFGFSKLEHTAKWGCFGWASLFIEDGWRGYRAEEDTLDRLLPKLRVAGFTAMDDTNYRREHHPCYGCEHRPGSNSGQENCDSYTPDEDCNSNSGGS